MSDELYESLIEIYKSFILEKENFDGGVVALRLDYQRRGARGVEAVAAGEGLALGHVPHAGPGQIGRAHV